LLFNSYEFIFAFLPIVFVIYFYLTHKRLISGAKAFLVFSSLFFYSWWNVLYLPILLSSVLFNYVIANILSKKEFKKSFSKKSVLIFGIVANLSLLAYFKYADFLIDNFNLVSGSSDGNLRLDDYINLARRIKDSSYEIVFSFGPDDGVSKEYIKNKLDFKATIFDSKVSLYEFTQYIASSFLFVSTSTGPMHLAGASNLKTLSFFGSSLFASNKRWATISDEENQNNFMLNDDYTKEDYLKIENRLKEILNYE
jgi:D-alanyl-lipoteichoic acid acyltransferase DltB (MBOAT superfamily)